MTSTRGIIGVNVAAFEGISDHLLLSFDFSESLKTTIYEDITKVNMGALFEK
jgi:hypothetical protein